MNGVMRRQVKQIHAHTLRNGLDLTQLILEKLLAAGDLRYAHSLLVSAARPVTTFLFNRLLQSYLKSAAADVSHSSHPYLAFSLYSHMRRHSYLPNLHTFTSLFSLCAAVALPLQGQSIHGQFIQMGFELDAHAATSLVDMYGKAGLVGSARRVFDGASIRDVPTWNAMISGYARRGRMTDAQELFDAMPAAERSVVSWTSMVSGYAHNGMHREAVNVFVKMWGSGGSGSAARPNEVTVASVLPACGSLGALELGRKIEAYARGSGFERSPYVANALLEMYAKCGSIRDARRVFIEMGDDGKERRISNRNLCSWNTMITGLAVHGGWEDALELFREMQLQGVEPDDVTFVGVLLACTHGGLVDEGRRVFGSMETRFSVRPKLEHYGCMVDLLGRAGLVREAYALIQSMPIEPDAVIWGVLLGACSFLGEKQKEEVVDVAEIAASYLFQMEPGNAGNYVILSNIYASCGRWDKVAEVWKGLKKGFPRRKSAGYSCVEVDGAVHKFLAEDKSHPNWDHIYDLIGGLHARLKDRHDDILDSFHELDT